MAIQRTITESTGIYERGTTSGEPGNVEDMKAVFMVAAEKAKVYVSWLQDVESEALGILKDYTAEIQTVTPWDGKKRCRVTEIRCSAEPPYRLPNDATPIARDAADAMFHVQHFRDAKERGDHDNAYAHAFLIGTIAERMGVRPFEPFVVTGRKVKQGNANAREIAYGTPEEQANRRNYFLEIWQDEWKKNPDGTVASIDEQTSQRLKADYPESSSVRTIRRYRKQAGLTAPKK